MSDSPQPSSSRRVILAGLIGNVMEWYDFAVYGYFATVIGKQFFPSGEPSVSLIAAFGAFAAGFLVRPLGGLLFGRIGDLIGRRHALTLSVLSMAVPTVLIGMLPTYQSIGMTAPLLIVLLRIVQGLSVGGEYTSSLVFLAEHAAPHRRSQTSIWGMWGATAGCLLGSAVAALVSNLLTDEQLNSYGWRIPFFVGALVAITGYLLRRGIHAEPPTCANKRPVRDTFGKHRWIVFKVALLNLSNGVSYYTAFVYSVTYIKSIDNYSESVALDLNTGAMVLLLLLLPAFARLSDRIGRRPLIIAGNAILAFGSIGLFDLMHSADKGTIFLGEIGFMLAVALIAGGVVAANVELMPPDIRCTGLAFAYNAAIGFFGGTTPLIAATLISTTGNPISPAWWVTGTGLTSLATAIFLVPETKDVPLSP